VAKFIFTAYSIAWLRRAAGLSLHLGRDGGGKLLFFNGLLVRRGVFGRCCNALRDLGPDRSFVEKVWGDFVRFRERIWETCRVG